MQGKKFDIEMPAGVELALICLDELWDSTESVISEEVVDDDSEAPTMEELIEFVLKGDDGPEELVNKIIEATRSEHLEGSI